MRIKLVLRINLLSLPIFLMACCFQNNEASYRHLYKRLEPSEYDQKFKFLEFGDYHIYHDSNTYYYIDNSKLGSAIPNKVNMFEVHFQRSHTSDIKEIEWVINFHDEIMKQKELYFKEMYFSETGEVIVEINNINEIYGFYELNLNLKNMLIFKLIKCTCNSGCDSTLLIDNIAPPAFN